MPDRRNLLSPRWLLGHLLALGLIVLFVNLGAWQLRRLAERNEGNALIAQRMSREPQPLKALSRELAERPGDLDYRPALARGRYDPENELLLRSRSRDGEPGRHVLTPLVQEDGRALLVDRGWVPYRIDETPVAQALPPEGEVEVEGLLRPGGGPPQGWRAAFAPRDPAEGELDSAFYVDVERLAPQMPYPLEPVYLQLASQSPPQSGGYPLPPEAPDLERGSHMAYALQWFSFALIGAVGYLLLLRSTVREGEGRA